MKPLQSLKHELMLGNSTLSCGVGIKRKGGMCPDVLWRDPQ